MSDALQLSISGIGKRFGDFVALDDIHVDVRRGEFLTLLGPSGSGKTTLLNILAGFLDPSSGRLIQGGRDITRLPAEQRDFGMVFQGYALFGHMTVFDNVAFALRIRKVPAAERKRRVLHMLEVVGLAEHLHKKPGQLSGGQQQRVAIARALVFEPQLLLLDEPLSALDKSLREQLQGELQRIHRSVGSTFVFVTHDQGEALALSSRIAIFNQGRLAQLDTPADLYGQPLTRFVAQFLGRTNTFALSDIRREGAQLSGRFEAHCLRSLNNRVFSADTPLLLAVRPEHMQLSGQPTTESGRNEVSVHLVSQVYQGHAQTLQLQTAGGLAVHIDWPAADAPPHNADGRLYLSWPLERGIVLAA